MYAQVLVEIKAKNIDKTFTYLVPKNIEENIKIGSRVLVPFGNQKIEGFVLELEKNKTFDYKVKEIISLIDENPVLNEELLQLGKYISKKTICNLINAYETMLPTALKAKHNTTINKKYVSYLSLNMEYNEALNHCKNESQKEIIKELIQEQKKADLNKISLSSIKTLLKNNIIKEEIKEEYRLNNCIEKQTTDIQLTKEQINTIDTINKENNFKTFLIHGVTGSGKTEVYMNLIEHVLLEKKEAIVLVPEISLTPQLVNTFRKRFGSNVAVLHSGLSNGEKYDEWRKIERKEVSIVIGARSAIFAPFTNIGIIIIDEEHSSTYKQENNPKYNAKDIAIFRGRYHNCKIVLGSATPSIESYTRAKLKDYELCLMENRINNEMPKITLIDMKQEYRTGNTILSSLLKEKINEKIKNNEQIILLLNRRGYTTITVCKECGYTLKCPNCDIPLTYHKSSNTCRCHYCGYGAKKLIACPNCNSKEINDSGIGTEKLEQYIIDNIENSKVIRMDVDTTSTKGSHEKIIKEFENKNYNILIGTQMISKGLDFPSVTLVGVINGDATLNIPDFRSAERTFQLLNQVSGRSGRSTLKGEVIIQGFNIDHYSILNAKNNDYDQFYKQELDIRKKLKYSPYFNLCLIKIKSKNINDCFTEGNKIVNYLKNKNMKDTIILGPSACNMPKINNIYHIQIIIKFKNTENIIKELNYLNELYRLNKVIVDIDLSPIRI